MTNESSTLPASQPENEHVFEDDVTMVLCPEEPELQIYVQGTFLRFTNGRLLIRDSVPGKEKILDLLGQSSYNLIICRHPIPTPVVMELTRRVSMASARKAAASDPVRVMNDAQLRLAFMTSTSQKDLPRMGVGEVAQALAQVMPQTVEASIPAQTFEEATNKAADAQAIADGLAAIQNDDGAEEADVPSSPWAAVVAEPDQPEPEVNEPQPIDNPPGVNPFG
jgi:hypothetical protein